MQRVAEGYGVDLILCGESVEEAMEKYGNWKEPVKGKGVRVISKLLIDFGILKICRVCMAV